MRASTLALLLAACTSQGDVPASLLATANCADPGGVSPARPVPECVTTTGEATTCDEPGSVRLWSPDSGLRPASLVPRERDSTQLEGGTRVPGAATGLELFKSVDVAGGHLFVAYNAGLQVWGLGTPALPARLGYRDGWQGQFLAFPGPGEVLAFVEDVSALETTTGVFLIALSGKAPVGLSLWEFTAAPLGLRQLYQDEGTACRQVRMVERGETAYAIAGGDGALSVFDATAAQALPEPCLDSQGTACPGVYLGQVPGAPFARYVDALVVGERLLVATGAGPIVPAEVWELDPANPTTARRIYSGPGGRGPTLFELGPTLYLAVIRDHRLQIEEIDGCPAGLCAPGPIVDLQLGSWPAAEEFLTVSRAHGRTWIYYGVSTGNVEGPDLERLVDVSGLLRGDLVEATAGSESYVDPCNGHQIRYWSHYYARNAQGLRGMHPRIGKFGPGGHFYRAAQTVLDVHVLPPLIFADGFEGGDAGRWR